MYEIISWIICGFAIFCVLINAVCTAVYSYKSDYGTTADFVGLFFINFIGIFGCIVNLVFFEHINILKLFLVILSDMTFCILLFYFSYDSVYGNYKKQVKQDNMNKSIKF